LHLDVSSYIGKKVSACVQIFYKIINNNKNGLACICGNRNLFIYTMYYKCVEHTTENVLF